MASFIKNTGDIILDAVLTDEGRRRLALGDGTFKITKFALADDEINYNLWNSSASSGFEDTQISMTPIFEAYTNNAASMQNKLMTLAETNILFLPILKLYNEDKSIPSSVIMNPALGAFVLPVASSTQDPFADDTTTLIKNLSPGQFKYGNLETIVIDQGLDSYSLDASISLSNFYPNLVENTYNVYMDSRLMMIENKEPLSIDDDYIAMYSFSLGDSYVSAAPTGPTGTNAVDGTNYSPIAGNRGTRLRFRPSATMQVKLSGNSLFQKMGDLNIKLNIDGTPSSNNYDTIRTNISVVGASTGYSLEIPVLLIRKTNS